MENPSKLVSEEVATGNGKATFIWRPGEIIDGISVSQIYGFCVTVDGLVALVRDKDEKRFTLPGGRLEAGEDSSAGLMREFIEEAQFEPKNIRLLGSVEVIETDTAGSVIKHHQQARFVCEPGEIREFIPEKDGWETVERIFVPPKELKSYIHWLSYPTGTAQYEAFMKSLKR